MSLRRLERALVEVKDMATMTNPSSRDIVQVRLALTQAQIRSWR